MNGPALLLADEPTGNLDTENSTAVLEILRSLNQRMKQTILMITHNPEAAALRAPHHKNARRQSHRLTRNFPFKQGVSIGTPCLNNP